MATYLVTVRERVDYTLRVEAEDHARAADAAIAALDAGTATCDAQVVDRQAIETEEA